MNSVYLSAVTLFPHHRELPVIMIVAEGQEVITHAARALAALLQTVTPETYTISHTIHSSFDLIHRISYDLRGTIQSIQI
jgi:uncharacterized protein with PhoU and TrkA domain